MGKFIRTGLYLTLGLGIMLFYTSIVQGEPAEKSSLSVGEGYHQTNRQELPERRGLRARHYQNDNGGVTAEIFARQQYFSNEDGQLTAIDSTLVAEKDQLGTIQSYRNTANRFRVDFAPTTGKDLYQFVLGKDQITFQLQETQLVNGRVERNTITYQDALPAIDLQYAILPDGIKESIILQSPAASRQFTYLLRAPALWVEAQPGGEITITREGEDQPHYVIPRPWMIDAQGQRSDDITVELSSRGVNHSITLRPDQDWLAQAVYPVVIDPGLIVLQPGSSSGMDTFIQNVNSPAGAGGSMTLPVGQKGTTINRSLLKFDLATIPPAATITSAELKLYKLGSEAGSNNPVTINAYRLTTGWLENEATWTYPRTGQNWITAGGDFDSTILSSVNVDLASSAQEWYAFDLASTVAGWYSKAFPNQGIFLKAADTPAGSLNLGLAHFASSDNLNAALWPRLEVTYLEDNEPPSISFINSPTNYSNVGGVVNLEASASDNTGVNRVEFYIDNVLRDTLTQPPYTFAWDTSDLPNYYPHQIKAMAYDSLGNAGITSTGFLLQDLFHDQGLIDLAASSQVALDTVKGIVSLKPLASPNYATWLTATSEYQTRAASKAIDNYSSTFWQSSGRLTPGATESLTLDLANTMTVSSLAITPQTISSTLQAQAEVLDASGNVVAVTGPVALAFSPTTLIINPARAGRQVRLTFSNLQAGSSGYAVAISEVKINGSAADISSITASSTNGLAVNVLDQNPGSLWQSAGQPGPGGVETLTVNLTGPVLINNIYLIPAFNGLSASIFASADSGVSWQRVRDIPLVTEGNYSFPVVSANRLRIELSNLQRDPAHTTDTQYYAALVELRVENLAYPAAGDLYSVPFQLAGSGSLTTTLTAISATPPGASITYSVTNPSRTYTRVLVPGVATSLDLNLLGGQLVFNAHLGTSNSDTSPTLDEWRLNAVGGSYNLIVNNPAPTPSLLITYPTREQEVSGVVSVTAVAATPGEYTTLEYYVDGNLRQSLATTSGINTYIYQWDTTTETGGNHNLMVRGLNAYGQAQVASLRTTTMAIDDPFDSAGLINAGQTTATVDTANGRILAGQYTNKILSRGSTDSLPASGFYPNMAVSGSSTSGYFWPDGGNDAFDYYGYPKVTINGTSQYLPLNPGTYAYTTGGLTYYVYVEKANSYLWRLRLVPLNNNPTPANLELRGNMGSDSSTYSFIRTMNFNGHSIPYAVNQDRATLDGTVADPRVIMALVPSDPADLEKVSYTWNGDNATQQAQGIKLPATIYVSWSYLTSTEIADWIQDDLTASGYQYSTTAVSTPVAIDGGAASVRLAVGHNNPAYTSASYYVSADGGGHWQSVSPGVDTTLSYPGTWLQLKANLFSYDYLKTPELLSWQGYSNRDDSNFPVQVKPQRVWLASPQPGVTVRDTVAVKAATTGNIQRVEFYLDGVMQFNDTEAPWEWNWNTNALTSGTSYILAVKAYDAVGTVYDSAPVAPVLALDLTSTAEIAGKVDSTATTAYSVGGASGATLQGEPGWWNTQWAYRQRLALTNNHNVTHQGEPVTVTVQSNRIAIDGKDLRLVDASGALVPFRIITSNNTSHSYTLVFETGLVQAGDSATYFIYYGNFTATSTSQAVPSTNYEPLTPAVSGTRYYDLYRNNSYFNSQVSGISLPTDGENNYYTYYSSIMIPFFDRLHTSIYPSSTQIVSFGSGTNSWPPVDHLPNFQTTGTSGWFYVREEVASTNRPASVIIGVSGYNLQLFQSGLIYYSTFSFSPNGTTTRLVRGVDQTSTSISTSASQNYVWVLYPLTKTIGLEETVYNSSGSLASQVTTSPWTISNLTVSVAGSFPAGTGVTAQVTADGGAHWQTLALNTPTELANPGDQVAVRLNLTTTDQAITPAVTGITVTTPGVQVIVANAASPATPGQLSASSGPGSASLSWIASLTSGVTYEVYRSLNSGFALIDGAVVASGLTTLTYTDLAVTPDTSYYYRVVARSSASAVSSPSNEVAVTPGTALTPSARLGLLDSWSFLPLDIGGIPGYLNLATGNLVLTDTDSVTPAPGLAGVVRRTYNSQDAINLHTLGRGWELNANYRLVEEADGTVVIQEGDGTRLTFLRNPDGSYTSPKALYLALTKTPSNTFTLSRKDGVVYNFNTAGRLQSNADRNNNILSYSYNASGNLTGFTLPAGGTTSLQYGGQGLVSVIKDPVNRSTLYTYSNDGYLLAATDPLGAQHSYTYDVLGRLVGVTDATGITTTVDYDSGGRVVGITDGVGNCTAIVYDPAASQTTVTDPNGKRTVFTYNIDGQLTQVSNPLDNNTSYSYDASGNLSSIIDPRGNTTSYTYNGTGDVTGIINALGHQEMLEYADLANPHLPTSRTNGRGFVTRYTYDSRGNLLTTFNPLEQITSNTYDSRGNLLTITDARNYGNANPQRTIYTYNTWGGVSKVTDALGNITSYAYDTYRQLATTTDPLGRVTRYNYNNLGWLTMVTYPDGSFTQWELDAAGRLQSETNTLDERTTYTYDNAGRLTGAIDPLGQSTSYEYDAAGNRIAVIDPNGNRTGFTFDADNQQVKVTDPLGAITTYAYDPAGNTTTIADALGHQITASYDVLNRRGSVTGPRGTITSTYDAASNPLTIADGAGNPTNYVYDEANRLVRVTDPLGSTTTYSYDAVGNRIAIENGLGFTTSYTYDQLNPTFVLKVAKPLL